MKCPHCGRENRSSAGFCAWCGGALPADRPSAATSPAPRSGPADEVPNQGGPPAPAEAGGPPATPTGERRRDRGDGHAPDEANAGRDEAPAPASDTESDPRARGPQAAAGEHVPMSGRPTVKLPEPAATSAEEPGRDAQAKRPPAEGAPLAPGTVVADRFEIVELLESSPEHNRYRARDLERCATCGYEGNAPGDAYCADCGASLQTPAYASIVEQLHVPPEAYDAHFSEGQRDYYVNVEPPRGEPEPPAEGTEGPPIRLVWGRATDPGLQRDHNEDYVEGWLYTRASGGLVALFVVADGLGGQDSGEVASKLATEAVWGSLRDAVWQPIIQGEVIEPDALEGQVAEAARAANRTVYEERTARGSEMSTTLTMALIVDATAYVANVGDSRTYLWNADGLQRITRDHSLVQRLVDAGQIAPEEVYSHPQRNLIYQSIGDRPDVQVDTFRRPLAADDRVVLCSDGLWEMVQEDGLEEVLLSEPDPQRACDRLVQNANLAGGEDNITVIIVQAQRA